MCAELLLSLMSDFASRLLLMPFFCAALSSHVWRSKASLKLVFINKPSLHPHLVSFFICSSAAATFTPSNVLRTLSSLYDAFWDIIFHNFRSPTYLVSSSIVARRHRILNSTLFCCFESITKLPLLTLDTFSYIIISVLLLLARLLMRENDDKNNGDEATRKKEEGKTASNNNKTTSEGEK